MIQRRRYRKCSGEQELCDKYPEKIDVMGVSCRIKIWAGVRSALGFIGVRRSRTFLKKDGGSLRVGQKG